MSRVIFNSIFASRKENDSNLEECPKPTMASEIKLFEMTKNHMHHLKECSMVALLVSVLISCLSTVLLHIYSDRQIDPAQSPVPIAFVIVELTINLLIALLTLTTIHSHLTKRLYFDDRQKHFNRVILILLISSLFFSLPFRSLAELIRGKNGFPSWVLLMCRDVIAAIASCLLFIFLWSYPTIWAATSEAAIPPSKASVCILYAVLRFALSFAFRVHFEPLPVQHLFSLSAIFLRSGNIDINPVPLSCILVVSAFECILIFCIYWNYSSCSRALYSANDPSKQQSIIALWYYGRAIVFLCASAFAAAVACLVSPATQTAKLYQETSVLVLSSPVGSSAISLAVFFYALRELYVHSPLDQKKISFALSLFISSRSNNLQETNLKEVDGDLLYRIADERDPQNEDPIPQPNTFSFESAMLLFNASWLATTYATRGMKPLTPSDFGRPMCAVRAVISDSSNAVVAVVLERLDRLIVTFKPVLPGAERRDYLRGLLKTDFGRSFSLGSEDQELLPVMEMSVPVEKLLKRSRLHYGYSEAYSTIQTELHTHIRNLTMDTTRPLYFTGFGSGAALATICAFDFGLRKISETNAISLYTYGSPRAMSTEMATLFETIVPCRWRCVVAGDCNTVKPSHSSYRHFSKVATLTRSGHLALEFNRVYKWWQSEVSAHPMHKISAYYCAFAKWHKAYHMKGSIDLWDWQIDKAVAALFCHETTPADILRTADFMLESPIIDVEAKSLRTLGQSISWPSAPLDDVVAFKR